jgi:hypothetical protein
MGKNPRKKLVFNACSATEKACISNYRRAFFGCRDARFIVQLLKNLASQRFGNGRIAEHKHQVVTASVDKINAAAKITQ